MSLLVQHRASKARTRMGRVRFPTPPFSLMVSTYSYNGSRAPNKKGKTRGKQDFSAGDEEP